MARGSWLLLVIVAPLVAACTPKASGPSDGGSSAVTREAMPWAGLALEPAELEIPIQRSDWRIGARSGDWLAVAAGIDALPEAERSQPGTRYVRALAGHRLGDCESVLQVSAGLADQVPLLRAELEAMVRECELALGLGAAARDSGRVSAEGRLRAARIAARRGDAERSLRVLDDLFEDRFASANASREELVARARALRAELAERLGLASQAERDYRWLALEQVSPGADQAYERLARRALTSEERCARAEILAKRGQIADAERELELAMSARGTRPSELSRVRIRALAHYSSRASYAEAARLYEEASRRSRGARASDLFRAAAAWVKSGELERGLAAYERIRKQHPRSAAEERAMYRRAQALYVAGRWNPAVEAYAEYLERYQRHPQRARFLRASEYERAVAELGRGNAAQALAGFERLRRYRRMGYSARSIDHLEAVALAASGAAELEGRAVERFEQLVERHPLSFVALSSAARLRRMGREPPLLPEPPLHAASALGAELPPKVRLLLDLGLSAAAERAMHETEPALRAEYAERAAEALCEHYALVDSGQRRYALGASLLGSGRLGRAPTPANSWAWHCLYPRPYTGAVESLEQRHGLPRGLLYAVMRQESAFRPDARSPAGAIGLMQLMPRTAELAARELGIEHRRERLTQPRYNLELGAFYLKKLLRTFDGRVLLALASYNAGPQAAWRWLSGGSELDADVWAARIPYDETRRYVSKVMTNWARYRYLAGGVEQVPGVSLPLPSGIELPADAY